MSLPTDEDLCTIRLPDKITDRSTQNKMKDFALAIDNMRRKLHAGLTDLGNVKITWNCGIETNFIGTTLNWNDVLKPGGVVTVIGSRFLNLLLTIDQYWQRKENASQKRDTKRKIFNWNDLLDMTAKESTYTLTSSTDTVREGESFSVTLTADNVDPDVAVGYNITGVEKAVISGARKYGNIVIGDDQTLTYTVASDSITSNKTFNFILSPADTIGTLTGSPSLSVTIENIDSSPEYSLTGTDQNITAGTSFLVTVLVENYVSTTVGYSFSGVEPVEVGMVSDQGTILINSEENITQFSNNILGGSNKTMTFTLDPTDAAGNGTGQPSIQFTLEAPSIDP